MPRGSENQMTIFASGAKETLYLRVTYLPTYSIGTQELSSSYYKPITTLEEEETERHPSGLLP